MKQKSVLTRDDVARILDHARAEAQANKWSVTIAVVDDGGHPLALERLDGAAPESSYIVVEVQVVGAVGVSGVKSSEDAQVARAGIASLFAPTAADIGERPSFPDAARTKA